MLEIKESVTLYDATFSTGVAMLALMHTRLSLCLCSLLLVFAYVCRSRMNEYVDNLLAHYARCLHVCLCVSMKNLKVRSVCGRWQTMTAAVNNLLLCKNIVRMALMGTGSFRQMQI